MDQISIIEILNCLPHRYPFLMLDKIIQLEPGESIVALKNVSINEPYFLGHFPKQPIMPGVLILEAMAQAAGVLGYYSVTEMRKARSLNLFAGVDNARFKRIVQPGDQLILEVKLHRAKQDIYKFSGIAKVDENIVCSADLLTARKEIGCD